MRKFILIVALAALAATAFGRIAHAAAPDAIDEAFADYRTMIGDGVVFYASCRYLLNGTIMTATLVVPRSDTAKMAMIERYPDGILNFSWINKLDRTGRVDNMQGGMWTIEHIAGLVEQLRVRDFRIATGKDMDHLPITGPQCDANFYQY
jgi:hypothetical protein